MFSMTSICRLLHTYMYIQSSVDTRQAFATNAYFTARPGLISRLSCHLGVLPPCDVCNCLISANEWLCLVKDMIKAVSLDV